MERLARRIATEPRGAPMQRGEVGHSAMRTHVQKNRLPVDFYSRWMMVEDILMSVAWRDFLVFAFKNEDLKAAYEADTGNRLPPPPTSAIDLMVDKATGYSDDAAMAFSIWATRTQWGWEDAPEKFRSEADEWQKAHPSFGSLGLD